MKTPYSLRVLFLVLSCAGIILCGCRGNQQQASTNATDQASSDPATANLAPVAETNAPVTSSGPAYPNSAGAPPPSYPPDEYDGEYSDRGEDTADESYYGVEPDQTAPDPPPPLPEYDQPPCPGDGYEWTPGYWDYASTGYYWVPGVWVQAPYVGALWTPGYWVYSHNHYAFFHGYWGPHIGFYGGINYGFGYVGVGYQGGYWNNGQFDYNRSVNNVNVSVVRNVYTRTVVVNRTTVINNMRVSYNGGSGGIQVRPQPAELAALREPHAAPMPTQIQVRRSASGNRSQFAAVKNGRPAQVADNRPVAAVANVRPTAPTGIHNLPATARPPMAARSNTLPANRPQAAPQPASRPEPSETPRNRPQPSSRPQMQTEPARQKLYRAAPNPNVANHAAPSRPQPQPRPEAQPSRSPAPQPRPEVQSSRPPESNRQAQVHPAPNQNRPPAPANRPGPRENRPTPQSHAAPPANRQAPEHNPPPKEEKDEHHPQ